MNAVNPYASPTIVDRASSISVDAEPANIVTIFFKWLLICAISAAPSFFYGLAFGTEVIRIVAMVTGVLMYVVAYTFVDAKYMRPLANANRRLRLTFRIGYGTRVVASIIFPVAMMIDIWFGMFSTMIVSSIPGLQDGIAMQSQSYSGDAMNMTPQFTVFVATLLTTLIQGAFLNVALAVYMAGIHGIQVMFSGDEAPLQQRQVPPAQLDTQVEAQNR